MKWDIQKYRLLSGGGGDLTATYNNGKVGKYGVLKSLPTETITIVTYEADRIVINTKNSGSYARFCRVSLNDGQPIDLTDLDTIVINCDLVQPNSYAECILRVWDTSISTLIKQSQVIKNITSNNISFSLDISNINGMNYITIEAQGYTNPQIVKISKIYLIKK